jgi:hypothetical protein
VDVLLTAEKIAGVQEVRHESMQRRLSSTLTKASIINTQYRTAGPAEEFDIVQVRGEVSRRPRAKQDHRGLILGHCRSHTLPYGAEPKAMQELTLGVRENDLLSLQTEIRWHLIAIPIREEDEGIEEAMEHRSNNA